MSPGAEEPPLRLVAGPAHAGLRAEAFLSLRVPFLSRTRVRQKIQTGESLLNGRRYATSARIREGDEITIRWRSVPRREPSPQLALLYEDEHLLAVDKPAGVASHPMGGRQSGTVIQFLRERFAADIQASLHSGGDFYPSLVNRLDLFTSGIVLAATTRTALRAMLHLVASRMVEKSYTALVEGVVEADQGRIELALGRDAKSETGVRMAPRPDGLPSVTEYRVLRRLEGATLLSIRPLTGRQHQVRAHLAAIGHPVWGDLIYKDEGLFLRYRQRGGQLDESLPPRHLLHAETYTFLHPFTGRTVVIHSPLPGDFMAVTEGFAAVRSPQASAECGQGRFAPTPTPGSGSPPGAAG